MEKKLTQRRRDAAPKKVSGTSFGPLVIVMIAAVLAPAMAAEEAPDPKVPVLIAKGDGYLVHAVQGMCPGYRVLHTSLATGEMKELLSTERVPPPMLSESFIHRTYTLDFDGISLVGLLSDGQRLYMLTRPSAMFEPIPPYLPSVPPDERVGWGNVLTIFWLADGSKIGEYLLPQNAMPETPPGSTLGPGPLHLIDNGVEVYGTTLRYDGATLVSQEDSTAPAPELGTNN